MINFRQVNFDQDIVQLILENHRDDNTLFLFPTVNSRNLAIKNFQTSWDFSPIEFLTFEEWKFAQFYPEHPILKEEKRSIAWFLSLDKKSKRFYNITDYFSSIDIGNKFFGFWEELNEELVLEAEVIEVLQQKATANNWQLNSFEMMLHIRDNYFGFIKSKQFSDKIFCYRQADLQVIKEYQEVVVVNQYYLTNLEKHLLQCCSDVTIYHQFPTEIFDKDNLAIKTELEVKYVLDGLLEKITEVRTAEEFSMINALFEKIEIAKPSVIVDFRFAEQSYSNFFSRDIFVGNNQNLFSQSSIFRFFYQIRNLVANLLYQERKLLIPLEQLLEAFSSDEILKYFCDDFKAVQTKLLNTIDYLVERDYLYLDLSLRCFKNLKIDQEVKQNMTKIFSYLQDLYRIDSMQEFNEFIAGYNYRRSLDDSEMKFTNIADIFAQIKSDFGILDKLDIVDNWQTVFSSGNFASQALKLFLDYMKPKKFKENLKQQNRLGITTLQDTRNLIYERSYILNVTEGVLPPKRKVPFLLSENQRDSLGLKTYNDIRNRDKYYFYRLLAQSKEVVLFSIENLDENREVSSFAEELRWNLADKYHLETDSKYSYKAIYEQYFKKQELLTLPKTISEQFHKIPFSQADLANDHLNLSFYKWQKLSTNAFEYYIQNQAKLSERSRDLSPKFSGKFIGNITHEIFQLIWERLIEVYQGNVVHHNFSHTNRNYIQDAVKNIMLTDKDLLYKLPHNYSNRYFIHIFLPILTDGIWKFFDLLHDKFGFTDNKITLLPETEKSQNVAFTVVDGIQVNLRGKADMRIEKDNRKYIFDYKTGSSNADKKKRFRDQLIIYEELYYLANKPELEELVSSYLYFVEKQDLHSLSPARKQSKTELLDDFKDRVGEVVNEIKNNGYSLAEKREKYENIEITRRDLLNKKGQNV